MDIVETPDGGYITGGWGADNGDFYLMKIDRRGSIVWVRQIADNGGIRGFMKKVIQIKDGNYIALGRAYRPDYLDTWIIKFDENGNIIWNKEITYPAGVSNDSYDVCETTDGGLILCGSYCPYANAVGSLVVKLNARGDIVWSRTNLGQLTLFESVEKNGVLFLVGFTNDNRLGVVVRMQSSDGAVLSSRLFEIDNKPTRFYNVEEKDDKLYINGNSMINQGTDGAKQIITILDLKLNVLKVYRFKLPLQQEWGTPSMFVTKDGSFVVAEGDDRNPDLLLLKVSYDGALEWKRRYTQPGDQRVFAIKGTSDEGVIGVGTSNVPGNGADDVYIFKTDSEGLATGCPLTDVNATIEIPPINIYPAFFDYQPASFPVVNINSLNLLVSIPTNTLCEKSTVTACNSLQIAGASTVCSLADATSYEGKRNVGCTSPVQWSVDTKVAEIISKTETTIQVKFKQIGEVKLVAYVMDMCQIFSDTLDINVAKPGSELNIGADTSICPFNSIELDAGNGYASYQWQDGSTGSKFIVTQPGKYFVNTTDACGNPFSDTVIVNPHPPIALDLGFHRTKCNSDTLHLNAPSGFLNYQWSNNYNISSTTAQNVIVNPLIDTAYYVKAEKTPGCFAYDTVRVQVNTSPPIILGADKSFCSGDSTVLDGGSGFNQYVWSNGSSAQQIKVKTDGTFSLIGITAQGCKSYDTISVNAFSNPVVLLDHTNYLCAGSSRILDAGTFTSFLWNDGSTSQKIIAKNVGIYAVQVTDNNGCAGRDTTRITTILPLPSGFLPNDTLLCSYDNLTISPLTPYNSYQWNNNATASSITVSQPGVYWLQVKDTNGCVGRDSISVEPKDCMMGFYVPTAFTPNHDGKNDAFRPMLFGKVKKYQFTIYNRWGQIVFQSAELNRAWDGTVAGVLQQSNVFTWICSYQFEGEEARMERGTVVLVR